MSLRKSYFNNIGILDIQNSQTFFDSPRGFIFNNTGTIIKSASTGTTDFEDTIFNNSGRVDIETTTFIVGDGGGTSTGRYSISGGAIVEFSGKNAEPRSHTLNEGANFIGLGLVRLTSGTLNVETTPESEVSAVNFEQTGGILNGADNFRVAATTQEKIYFFSP